MDDHSVIVAALEKTCKICDDLIKRVADLENEIVVIKKNMSEYNSIQAKLEDSAFYANGKTNLYEWMMKEKDKPAYDTPISNTELTKKFEDYKSRKKI
jgi:hypothetical protein